VSKPVLALVVVVLLGCAAAVVLLGRDLQRERMRADALAERLIELEPLERPGRSILNDADLKHRTDAYATAQQSIEPPPTSAPEQLQPVEEVLGTLQTRQQVERLQSALESATPLQSYQIRALITAIDKVRNEIEQEESRVGTQSGSLAKRSAETNRRIVRAAADILFESQLDTFVQLLDDELEAQKKNE
jgi:hypothetical protein